MSKTRNKKRTAAKAEKHLQETVRSFMLSVPPSATRTEAEAAYQRHNARWMAYCQKMELRHKWIRMDAQAFQQRVLLLNKAAERKMQPVKYYGRRIAPVLVLAIIIWMVTDLALPYFGITQYQLFR
jgi:hypothetical protein